jgi:hypothetical protein
LDIILQGGVFSNALMRLAGVVPDEIIDEGLVE